MRIQNTIKNSTVSLGCQVLSSLLSFVNRTFFIHFLGVEHLGISGLFTNILSVLSLAELGIGTAITFCLYKPIAQNEKGRIAALMHFYKVAYRYIGITVLAIGLLLIPFLTMIIGEQADDIDNLTLIYVLFLANSVISYFFTYKCTLFTANQQEYVNKYNRMSYLILQNIGQFCVLVLYKNYYMYLLVAIACTFLSNLSISRKCDLSYPYLKEQNERLEKQEKKKLFKYVYAQTCHQIGGVAVNGTDNILLTAFLPNGLYYVGLYANYTLICGVFKSFINSIFNSVVASVGNLNATETKEKSKEVFDKMLFINYLLYGFCAACILVLQKEFVSLWIGEKYILGPNVVVLIVINFYLSGMRQSCITYNTTLGLFWNDRFKPLFEAGINLVSSILLMRYFGFSGVLLGTLISNLTTNFWVEPYLLYKYGFNKSVLEYFLTYARYFVITCVAACIAFFICKELPAYTLLGWIIKAAVCAFLVFSIQIIPFISSKPFIWICNMVRSIFRRSKKLWKR